MPVLGIYRMPLRPSQVHYHCGFRGWRWVSGKDHEEGRRIKL